MPDRPDYPDPRKEDIIYGDRRISRPDVSLPDWEMPDTAYRPIPIVWFTAAMLGQLLALGVVFTLFGTSHGAFTIGTSALVTAVIGAWTWERGMRSASTGWKIATIAVLLVQFLLIGVAASERL
ncbi:hypothetical protein [Erythrobacter sp. JK5]|uniref:hypothetical protein n=1 Tax=Erythrobacter sp. JK5 TaxID=2829500 RepID=UPI001BA66492|nr:hypothetical protein [Erythrobacter sp. JK5]QUL38731.1 hypothetical protein KDC96_04965 [Erythrobacter sp. JK5]